ncbi:Acetyl-CoA synthetase (ADP forming), alpha and beta subunit fusion [Candidatus Zixiibacteriota bacterium]|nr:Acetyl-CoA synthetase (ADP forming), alpha and beta subunit fusion [candidate division Zixibacteria bacterium]
MRGLEYIFRPKSVAVIGASTHKGTIGHEILHNIIINDFNGKVFPVNPKATVIHSIKCYSTILDVPDAVDMAVIVVPREIVCNVAEQCGQKGVKGLVVISAGFKEVGGVGVKLEEDLVKIVHKYNMRMIGPNCFGIVNTEPEISLNCTFGKTKALPGKVGFVSQSGGLGEAIMNHARELGLGFSMVASIGNKADVSTNDILEFWKDDPQTDIILLYLENFGNPRHFTRIAREISPNKPIVAVKSGRTRQGAAAASSHTGALAELDVGVDALLDQCGVLRVSSIEELFDVASAMSNQPIPKGNRVAIVSNAGGPALLATDALVGLGMNLAPYAGETKARLKKALSGIGEVHNPLDLVAGAGGEHFKSALSVIKNDRNFDSIFIIFVPPVTINQMEVAQSILDGIKGCKKTVLVCFMGAGEGSEAIAYLKKHRLPVYIFPEAVAKTLSQIDIYRRWLERPRGRPRLFKTEKKKVQEIINQAVKKGEKAIIGKEALEVLRAYGIPAAQYYIAFTDEEAAAAAEKTGYPVVLKVNTPQILHKTEFGAVLVDLRNAKEVREGFNSMKKKLPQLKKNEKYSVVIQEMVTGGVETVIGMTTDPSFGPLIMFGLGGIYVEILKDVAFRINPLNDIEVGEMISGLKSYPLLTGYRGSEPIDMTVLKESLLRLSQLVSDFDQFSEIDINPFIACHTKGKSKAVDARFIIRQT